MQANSAQRCDAESCLYSVNAHHAVAATGTFGEAQRSALEGVALGPFSLHSPASCVHAQYCSRKHNLWGLYIGATRGLIYYV